MKTGALRLDAPQRPDWTLCLDFGTAKSKACAATDEDKPELVPLPLGKADGDDRSVHAVSSSIWIDDDGRLFLGSEAIDRGESAPPDRQGLDSIKLELRRVDGSRRLKRLLPRSVDPTKTLTYEDAITCFLAYLTDLAVTELKKHPDIDARYVKRKFTLPGWPHEQRERAGSVIATGLMRGQLLADTFHGRWRRGIPVRQVKDAIAQAILHDGRLDWLLTSARRDGVLEGLAAGSAQVHQDSGTRDVVLVIDVGAGTTDISLFWVVQDPKRKPPRRAFPIVPVSSAIPQAGDRLDDLLIDELERQVNPGVDLDVKKSIDPDLRRRSRIRRIKEQLFEEGRITERLANDVVRLSVNEFMHSTPVKRFEAQIARAVGRHLKKIHSSWGQAAEKNGFTIVLTGGGSTLPMIRALGRRRWQIGNRDLRCRVIGIPKQIEADFGKGFAREYPQLAVAMGGVLPELLDERSALRTWEGATGHRRLPKQGFV